MKNSIVRSSFFDPLNDFLFYKLFGEKGDEVQLLGFINAVLGKTEENKFTSIEILENKTFTPDSINNKSAIFDVRAVLQDKTRVNVEVQLRNKYNMEKRSLFYCSEEFTTSLKSGQNYRKLPNVIAINIVNFNYLDTKDFHNCFHLRDDKERDIILTEALEIHFINMVRYRKQKGRENLKNPLCRWLAWFDKRSPPELLMEVVKMDAAIQAVDERMIFLEYDEEARRTYLMRQKALRDHINSEQFAIERGIKRGEKIGIKIGEKIGEKRGMEKNAIEIAKKLKARGRPINEIVEDTGLSTDEIEKL